CASCGHSFLEPSLIQRLATLFENEGADIWFEKNLAELLPDGAACPVCGGGEFRKGEDILDVWFDSGVSFAAVLEKRDNLKFPADLYLEGSDQHRGWFHSALLASVGARGTPPYNAVLTHGFVVDGAGRKMSKSTGNVIAPQEVIGRYGAEVLRLWVCAENYREDIRISEEILKRLSEAYRRIRNTFRYILGNLYDFDPDRDAVAYDGLEELDRLTLHRLTKLTESVRNAYDGFEFHTIYHSVHNFCTVDLSAFYLDILKDRLYTSGAGSGKRRAAQTAIYHVLDHLVRMMAPILVFTTDEAWSFMPGKREESVHLSGMPEANEAWRDPALGNKWDTLLRVKEGVSKAMETARQQKTIGHPLDAKITIYRPEEIKGSKGLDKLKAVLAEEEKALEEILIVSRLMVRTEEEPVVKEGVIYFESDDLPGFKLRITVEAADGEKCERCWRYSVSVGSDGTHPTICGRCLEALK
ncbi:MAG: class I tRNA ligase family protein, partial [Deltaproteobacteria bacterium]